MTQRCRYVDGRSSKPRARFGENREASRRSRHHDHLSCRMFFARLASFILGSLSRMPGIKHFSGHGDSRDIGKGLI